jgi:hypothetical protein
MRLRRLQGFSGTLEQGEETGLADAQYLLNLGSRQQSLAVSIEQYCDRVICEPLVQLSHFRSSLIVRLTWKNSIMTGSLFN